MSEYLRNCNEVYFVGITAGELIVKLRDDNQIEGKDLFLSVIADAVGSEFVEGGIDYIHNLLQNRDRKFGKFLLKMRFSPGYQDLLLSYQRDIHNILSLDKIGIKLSESYIMYPEKSITALIGVQ